MTSDQASFGKWPKLTPTEGRILLELLLHGSRSRVRLAERVGMSKATLTRMTRALSNANLIVEGNIEARTTRGRPEENLQIRPEAAHFFGVKLTAETMYFVMVNLAAQIVTERVIRLDTNDAETLLAQIADHVLELAPDCEIPAGIGVAIAGDVTGSFGSQIVEKASFLGWQDVPVAATLQRLTGLPVSVVNDVHALTAAHHWFGEDDLNGAADSSQPRRRTTLSSVAVISVGAGIGSGAVVDDTLVVGANGRGGRVGHHRMNGSGRRCHHGHTDCVHSFVTIPAIEHNAKVNPGEYLEVVRRAHEGDEVCREALERAAFALGVAIADIVNVIDPEVIALMGEGLHMLDIDTQYLQLALAEYLEQGNPKNVPLQRPRFNFNMYSRGAAVCVMREILGAH